MYRYDQYDKVIIQERVAQFRDQVRRRLEGKITENEFKPLRLQNGLYMQLHAYMLRVAIPYGLLSSEQLRKLAHIARVYDKGYAHFSTRQNVQYNWPALEDVPKILDELASEYDGRVRVGKVNVDEEQALAMAFGVRSIPMLAVVKGGEIVHLEAGFRGRESVVKLFEQALG